MTPAPALQPVEESDVWTDHYNCVVDAMTGEAPEIKGEWTSTPNAF